MEPSLQRAWQLYRFHRYPLALEETVKFLGQCPESADGHCLLALINGKLNRENEAFQNAEDAIRYASEWSYTHYCQGIISYWFNCLDMAISSIQMSLRHYPEDSDCYELLAIIHLVRKEYLSALEEAEKGLAYNPEHIGCLTQKAYALTESHREREAIEVYENILAINPTETIAQGMIGKFEVARGRYREALPLLRNALRDNPNWEVAQQSWKQALCGSYSVYGAISKIRTTIFFEYLGLCFVMLMVVAAIFIYFVSEMKQGILEHALLSLLIGAAVSASLLMLIYLLADGYLHLVSRLLLLYDTQMRRTIIWQRVSQWMKHSLYRLLWIAGMIIAAVVFIYLKANRN